MILVEHAIENWQRFGGRHSLVLEGKHYAVTARWRTDAERSNWGGKSAFLESVRFVLFGEHRFRTDDEWIFRGASEGVVRSKIVDGPRSLVIERTKKRGKPTRLKVRAGDRELAGEEAQAEIESFVGFGSDDFEFVAYFEQGEMKRLVKLRPEEAANAFVHLLRLEKLRAAEKDVAERAEKFSTLADDMRRADDIVRTRLTTALEGCTGGIEELRSDLASCVEDVDLAAGELFRAENVLFEAKAAATEEGTKNLLDQLERLRREATELDAPMLVANAEESARIARERADVHAQLVGEVRRREVVARGEFDGACPIASLLCPARDRINADRASAAIALQEARGRAEEARKGAEEGEREASGWAGRLKARDARLVQIRQLNDAIKSLPAPSQRAAPTPEAIEAAKAAVEQWRAKLAELGLERVQLNARIETATAAEMELSQSASMLTGIEAERDLHLAAASVLREARRQIVATALSTIESEANEILQEAGVDLVVTASWSREGSGKAKACPECGASFPESARIKACERCGAPRGKHVVNRLEIVLSDRSGAAEDLAGIALGLAASSWLRTDRGSGWGLALLDEPTAQLDAAHRRMFASHVARMLAKSGFVQSFCVAHHEAVLAALPGRIQIDAGPESSSIAVVG